MGDMRVRVKVSALRERVALALGDAQRDFEKESKSFVTRRKAYAQALVTALHSAVQDVEQGVFPDRAYGGVTVRVSGDAPSEPSEREIKAVQADPALLDLAADDVLTIGHQDRFARYLR